MPTVQFGSNVTSLTRDGVNFRYSTPAYSSKSRRTPNSLESNLTTDSG